MSNASNRNVSVPVIVEQKSLISLKSLQQAAMKLADLKSAPKALSTKALVGLLICQTQRNRRLFLPPVRIHLRVENMETPAYLRFGGTDH